MRKVKFADARITCELLIEQQQFDRVSSVIELSLPFFMGSEDWKGLLEILNHIPKETRIELILLAVLYAKALAWTRPSDELFAFCDLVRARHGLARAAPVEIERAITLYELHRYLESCACLESAMEYLEGEHLGIAWSKLGISQYALGKPWHEAFQRAKKLLSGIELGRSLVNEGSCFSESNQGFEARCLWLEALPYFESNIVLQAATRYNLGISALRDFELEAERHLMDAVRLSKNLQVTTIQTLALNGLGATRRSLGEWSRAEACYVEALKVATDAHGRKESHLGLTRTLRLSGRYSEALESLEVALHDSTLEPHLFYVARALTLLSLGQTKRAKDALEKVGTLVSESDRWLEKMARAELARQEDQFDTAIALLEGLPIHTLHAREEVRQYPQLFLLLEGAEKEVPQPLEYVTKTTINVRAQGTLRVTVNARAIHISSTGRVGELLVFLLEQGGSASIEVIADALYPKIGDGKEKARKNVWTLVQTLRNALGWKDSVLSLRGAYQLDPKASWDYDIDDARETRKFRGEFLAGVYSDWALEVGRELAELHGERRKNLELN